MIGVVPCPYLGYKFTFKTKILKPSDVDLKRDLDQITEYEETYDPYHPE